MFDKDKLLSEAFKAMDNAYAPYSNYHVGACVATKDGKYILGCNIENAAYGPTICGERTAIFATYALGYRKDDIEALAVVSSGKRIGYCCGTCRQVLSELLNEDTPIIFSNGKQENTLTIKDLLPYSFGSEDLN